MSSTIQQRMILRVLVERQDQDEKWGGADHDDNHDPRDWIAFIAKHLGRAANFNMTWESFQYCMIRVAAIALAAAESIQRNMDRSAQIAVDESILREATTPAADADGYAGARMPQRGARLGGGVGYVDEALIDDVAIMVSAQDLEAVLRNGMARNNLAQRASYLPAAERLQRDLMAASSDGQI